MLASPAISPRNENRQTHLYLVPSPPSLLARLPVLRLVVALSSWSLPETARFQRDALVRPLTPHLSETDRKREKKRKRKPLPTSSLNRDIASPAYLRVIVTIGMDRRLRHTRRGFPTIRGRRTLIPFSLGRAASYEVSDIYQVSRDIIDG